MKVVLTCCLLFALLVPAAAQAAPDRTPPTTPTGLRVVSVTEDSVTLRWNASTDNSGRIQRYVVNGIYHDGSSTTKTMTGLVPNYSVTYRVVAVDAAGNSSAPSAPLTATTARDTTAPTAVTGLRVTGVTPSSVSLAWNAAYDRWSLSYVLSDGSTASATSATVRGLAPGSTHTFSVRARDTAGNLRAVSNAVTVTLPSTDDTTAPAPPSNLTATDARDNCGGNLLTWTQPEAGLDYQIFLGSALYARVSGTGFAYLYTLSGTNTWTVVAVDAAGNRSAPSNPATVTVVADVDLC
jgi:chitin-binding protein